jgi:hypothetical protein
MPAEKSHRSLREFLFRFRGAWDLTFTAQRYFRSSLSGVTPGKLANATRAVAEMRAGRIKVSSRPFVIRIEPANVCNLRCPRCSCGVGIDPRERGFLSLDDLELALEQNRENAILLRLDGNGEPTLNPKIFEMVSMAKGFGLSVSMSSNFCTSRSAQLADFIDSGLDRLIVAIDGDTQESYEKYRVGGELKLVEERVANLLELRRQRHSKRPIVEVQFLDWGYNHGEILAVRSKAQRWGADKFEVIVPDRPANAGLADPDKPRRCFWLWCVQTLDWALNYRACTNAWTLPWPRLNLRDCSSEEFWNSEAMHEARRYNVSKQSEVIARDKGCNCNDCSDMLVVDRPEGYVCR